jgi:hypothetical protein
MKNKSRKQRKTSISLPLEGGGKRVGVKELRDLARATPHPAPLPQGERGINFDKTWF